jgi:hypothetical protein
MPGPTEIVLLGASVSSGILMPLPEQAEMPSRTAANKASAGILRYFFIIEPSYQYNANPTYQDAQAPPKFRRSEFCHQIYYTMEVIYF